MAKFRLVHASDFHLAHEAERIHPYDRPKGTAMRAVIDHLHASPVSQFFMLSSYCIDAALEFAATIERRAGTLDGVIITGDIATTGSLGDLMVADDFFHGRAREEWARCLPKGVSPMVRAPGLAPLLIMPGNHDRYGERPTYHPDSREFERLFGTQWNFHLPVRAGPHAHHRWVRTTVLSKEGAALAVCRADFSLTDSNQADLAPFAYMGQGRVMRTGDGGGAPTVLDELVAQTAAFRRHFGGAAAVIWCVHSPPQYPNVPEALRLIGDADLVEAARQQGIALILSGHTHMFSTYLLNDGATRVVCCGSTTGTACPNANMFLDLLVDTDNMRDPEMVEQRWNPATAGNRFVPVATSPPQLARVVTLH